MGVSTQCRRPSGESSRGGGPGRGRPCSGPRWSRPGPGRSRGSRTPAGKAGRSAVAPRVPGPWGAHSSRASPGSRSCRTCDATHSKPRGARRQAIPRRVPGSRAGSRRRMTRATIPHRESSVPAGVSAEGTTSRTSTFPDGRSHRGTIRGPSCPRPGSASRGRSTGSPRARRPPPTGGPGVRGRGRSAVGRTGGTGRSATAPRGGPSSGSDTRRAASGPPSGSPRSQPPRSRIRCSGMNRHRPIEVRRVFARLRSPEAAARRNQYVLGALLWPAHARISIVGPPRTRSRSLVSPTGRRRRTPPPCNQTPASGGCARLDEPSRYGIGNADDPELHAPEPRG